MKKLFVLFGAMLIGFHSLPNNPVKIDEQLLQNFSVQFPHAQKIVWQESEDAYTVSFVEDGIRLRVVYLRNGALTHFLRYYLEENLPLDVRLSVKKKFPGKSIYGVVEENLTSHIQNKTSTVYYIKLEDDCSWTTVRVQRNKKMKIVGKLNKDT